ncbi:hypothetical protein, partial [Rhodococcus sp. 05-2256-B4]|uniref:hypothetical protein n=1 Tax=Rhodococcus sp. 05-2256-B4 TaxID=2022491 RepID=UPI001C3C4692
GDDAEDEDQFNCPPTRRCPGTYSFAARSATVGFGETLGQRRSVHLGTLAVLVARHRIEGSRDADRRRARGE